MGLGPQTASLEQGKILVNGQDMTQADGTAWNTIRGKDVSMIFQEPMTSLNPLMKVGRQIAENATNRGVSKAQAKEKALEMIRLAGLPDAHRIYECYPHQLSGGQRQRIMICLALINQPKLRIAGLSAGHQQKRTATGEYQAQCPSFGKTSGNRLYLCKPMRRMYGLLHTDHAKADCIWTA